MGTSNLGIIKTAIYIIVGTLAIYIIYTTIVRIPEEKTPTQGTTQHSRFSTSHAATVRFPSKCLPTDSGTASARSL